MDRSDSDHVLLSSHLQFADICFAFFNQFLKEVDEDLEQLGQKMGGDGHDAHVGDFRQKVWTMTGGPNCRPKHWKRNTAIAMFGIFLACIPVAMLSAKLEQRPHMPVRPIPSQLWCKNFGNQEYEKRE